MRWTDAQIKALELSFAGRLSHDKIAADCSTPLRTLRDWLAHPDFIAKLTGMRERALEALVERGVPYVRKEQRVIALAQLAEQARSQYEGHELLIETRPTRDGDMTTERFNRDAFESVRGALDDIAKELGHRRPEKSDGNDAANIVIRIETDHDDSPRIQVVTDGESTS